MDETIKAIQTRDGPKQIDYNALANKPFETLGETLSVVNGVLNIVIPPEYGRVSYNGFELTIE